MKKWITSAAIFAAAFFPQAALAAEETSEGQGSWTLLMFFTANFILFVFILVYFAGPALRKFFSDRAVAIRTGLSRAEKAFEEAQDLANKTAARMAALTDELKKLRDGLEAETAYQVSRIRELAKANADRIHRDAELSASAQAEAAKRRVRAKLAESATSLARDLISRNFQPADQSRLIDGFMEKVGGGATR